MLRSEKRFVVSNYMVDLGSAPEPVRIVQVSDLHGMEFGRRNRELLSRIRQEAPDLVFVTGDILRKKHVVSRIAVEFLETLVTIAPVYFVSGNHEYVSPEWGGFRKSAEKIGVRVLGNTAVRHRLADGRELSVAGINDYYFFESFPGRYRCALERLAAEASGLPRPLLLLAHRPEFAELYARLGFDVVFSGHAHGGQIRLPLIGALYAPRQGLFPKYADGHNQIEKTHIVVSRGLGPSRFPIRVFNPPELVTINLHF